MPRYRPKARIIRTFLLVPPSSFFRPRSAMPAPYGESERCVMLEAATWNGKWRKSLVIVAPSYFLGRGGRVGGKEAVLGYTVLFVFLVCSFWGFLPSLLQDIGFPFRPQKWTTTFLLAYVHEHVNLIIGQEGRAPGRTVADG